ncbi:Hypothetical predicted protein, partial [Marmota monax]
TQDGSRSASKKYGLGGLSGSKAAALEPTVTWHFASKTEEDAFINTAAKFPRGLREGYVGPSSAHSLGLTVAGSF